jgi:YD repeat-containing protein
MVNGSNSWNYAYNYLNQLTSVKLGSTGVALYSYDGAGNMLNQTVGDHEDYLGPGLKALSVVLQCNTQLYIEIIS